MPKCLLMLALLPLLAHGQRPAFADSTTVRLLTGAESAELNELLSRVMQVEKFRLELHDRRLAGRQFRLTQQEYLLGVPGPEKPLTTSNTVLRLDTAGRLAFAIYARQVSATTVQNTFVLPRATLPRTFTAQPGRAGDYSLSFGLHPLRRAANQAGTNPRSPAEEFGLPLGQPAILAVYTLPYEADNMLYYCRLVQSRVPVAEWYARYRVPHYVVYRARIE